LSGKKKLSHIEMAEHKKDVQKITSRGSGKSSKKQSTPNAVFSGIIM
jgi:hypothetical protein